MNKSRFTEEQIIGIVKQHEAGVKTADLCREHASARRRSMAGSRSMGGWEPPVEAAGG
jgi:putative transposase